MSLEHDTCSLLLIRVVKDVYPVRFGIGREVESGAQL